MNCALFALSLITDVPLDEIDAELRRYVDCGWAALTPNGDFRYVVMPEAAADLLPRLGLQPTFHYGHRLTAADWARWRRAARLPALLVTATHALVTRDGLLIDNRHPNGLPAGEHPYARVRVERAIVLEPD